MRAIPITDPRFQAVYDAVLATMTKPKHVKGGPDQMVLAKDAPATIGDFSDWLQMGDTYIIQKGEVTESCGKCMGAGRVHQKDGAPRTGDGKAECSACKGVGKSTRILQLLIKW